VLQTIQGTDFIQTLPLLACRAQFTLEAEGSRGDEDADGGLVACDVVYPCRWHHSITTGRDCTRQQLRLCDLAECCPCRCAYTMSLICDLQRAYCSSTTRWNDNDRGKPEELREKPVPVPVCPPQIPHRLNRARTRTSTATGW
jgi:hypothetical protein